MKRQSPIEEPVALRRQFQVESIMVAVDNLTRANEKEDAARNFAKYDIVPWPLSGPVDGYFSKTDGSRHQISKEDLIGGGTSLLDLLQLFNGRSFYFVLHGNKIAGFVNVSDLNHNYARIPLFGMLQLVEQRVWEDVQGLVTEKVVQEVFPKDFKNIMKCKRKKESENLDIGWACVLYIAQILKPGVHFAKLNLDDDEIGQLSDVRNAVAHPQEKLIAKRTDLGKITKVCEMSKYILSSA